MFLGFFFVFLPKKIKNLFCLFVYTSTNFENSIEKHRAWMSGTMSIRDQAKLCFQKGKFSAAADAYTEAITQEPGNAALYQNRALCYQKLSKWTNVVEDAGG